MEMRWQQATAGSVKAGWEDDEKEGKSWSFTLERASVADERSYRGGRVMHS